MKKNLLLYTWIISIILQITTIVTRFNYIVMGIFVMYLTFLLVIILIKAVRNTLHYDAGSIIVMFCIHLFAYVLNLFLFLFAISLCFGN